MIRVHVRNFQSIAEESIEIAGFSVVVGRSNIGKSALVRAVKAALTGAPADNYIRHGSDCQRAKKGAKSCKCFCSVRIVAPSFDLLWEKGDAVNRYVFNGTEHTVVGRGTPEFLGEALAPVPIGGDSTPTLLQVADQFRPLFILDRSGTAVADVLSDVAKLDQINDAARAVEKDKRECAAARKLRDKDFKELTLKLDAYEGLDAIAARVEEIERKAMAVNALETRVALLARLEAALLQCTGAFRALQPVVQIEVPTVLPLVEHGVELGALSRWQASLRGKPEAIRRLEDAAAVVVPEISGIQHAHESLRRIHRWVAQLGAIKAAFAKLKAAEVAVIPEAARVSAEQERVRALSLWVDRICGLETAIQKLQRTLAQAEREEAEVLDEFRALEVCPTCRQPVVVVGHSHLGAA